MYSVRPNPSPIDTFIANTFMPFVKIKLERSEIEKFRLHEMWTKYHPFSRHMFSGTTPVFVIDRDRDVFLIRIDTRQDESSNTSILTLLLSIDKKFIEIKVEPVSGLNPQHAQTNPFRVLWNLRSIRQLEETRFPKDYIVAILKEGLSTYGDVSNQVTHENVLVDFNF